MPELEPWGRECPMGTGIVTLDENDNRLNRKNPHAPSFDRKENQEVWEEAIKPDLDAADITGAIPEELILTDRRHTEKQKENRKVKEIKIMDRIDEELDQIRDQNLDTHHRIDENLRTWCKRLILLASKKRTEYGLDPYKIKDIKMDTREIWWTDHLHWDHARKSGRPYAREHIFDGYKNLITLAGLVGRISRTTMLRHDDKEDLQAHINHSDGLDPTLLIARPFQREYREEGSEELDQVIETLSRLIDGLSQIKLAKKDDKKIVGLIKLLETIVENPKGIIALAVKAAERLDNIGDISTNYEERQRPIMEETLSIYGALTRLFRFYGLHEAILKTCAKFLHSDVIENFEEEQKKKGRKLLVEGEHAGKLKQALQKLADQNRAITFIAAHPRPLHDYIEDVNQLLIPDSPPIEISSRDTMHEIVIMAKKESEIGAIRTKIVQALTPREEAETGKITSERHPRGGTLFKIFNPEFGGQLRIHVITEYDEAMSLKGVIGETAGTESTPPQLRQAIETVLKETAGSVQAIIEETEEDSDAVVADIIRKLHERIFRKTIKVRMPDNTLREFPDGATVIDACAEHSTMLRAYRGAEIFKNVDSEHAIPVEPWHRLRDSNQVQIKIESPEAIQTDLGWINFATTEEGIKALKNYFSRGTNREKRDRGTSYLKRLTTLLNLGDTSEALVLEALLALNKSDQFPQTNEWLIALKKKRQMEHGHPTTIKKIQARINDPNTSNHEKEASQNAIKNLEARLSTQTERANEVLNIIREEIGKGQINPLELLGEAVQIGPKGLAIEITLSDTPGESDEILKMIADDNINKNSIRTDDVEGEEKKKMLYLTLRTNEPGKDGYRDDLEIITPLDLLQCLLKIQYKNPSIRINSDPFSNLVKTKIRDIPTTKTLT